MNGITCEVRRSHSAFHLIPALGGLQVVLGYWFEGVTFTHGSDGTTILHGPVTDQAALYGILNGIEILGWR